jgi:hypothetical protein
MKRFFKFLKDNQSYIKIGFLFVVTTVAIVYLFPADRRFKYEFDKGSPWLHEDYVAKFDFPIYKSEQALAAERDSILDNFDPYFNYLATTGEEQIQKFREKFRKVKQKTLKESPENLNKTQWFMNNLENRADTILEALVSSLETVYQRGIINNNETYEQLAAENKDAVLIIDGIAEEYPLERLFTQKLAYEYVIMQMDVKMSDIEPRFRRHLNAVVDNLNIDQYLVPNVFYDETTSEKVREDLLSEISLTRGLVQKGERVVSNGEIVDARTYRILESLRREYEAKTGGMDTYYLIFLGKIILALVSMFVLYLFLYNFRREILENSRKTVFILFLVLLVIFTMSMVQRNNVVNHLIIPITILPIIIRTFYDGRLALFIHIIAILIIGFFVPNGFEFVFLNFIAGIVAILSLTVSHRRGKLIVTALLVSISYCLMYFAFSVIQEGQIESINFMNFAWFGLNGVLILIAFPLIYVFEKTFGFLSDATLMELADTNQLLLRRLAERAPGTFQHSMQVANLAEEAIVRVGGNPLLVRTGALYHDIGKIEEPIYFIENQTSGINPHDTLEFQESAEKIINHVTKGVEIAKKHSLPEPIIDFIRTHHGTTTVQYFYKSYVKTYPNEKVDIRKFKYPGPKPFSKETAVLMMADSTEAASRSLKEITIDSIDALVEGIINHQIMEDQFIDADITFKDITTIKKIFKDKLQNIYHARISYPK